MAGANEADADGDAAGTVAVTFHPQEWVDSPGEAHDWDRRQLADAPDRDPVTFSVPRAAATDAAGDLYPDKSYEANLLADHGNAPTWVRDWDGPYYVRLADD